MVIVGQTLKLFYRHSARLAVARRHNKLRVCITSEIRMAERRCRDLFMSSVSSTPMTAQVYRSLMYTFGQPWPTADTLMKNRFHWTRPFRRQVYYHISILRFLHGLPLHFETQLSLTKVTKSDQYPLAYPVSRFTLLRMPSAL
ncbi:uncharacterized protein LACBIDRAFT_329343 [Laccaria bicolor S238N-H82]|uniref:Predicted protein n=1 Tax=Laccaria bicolor (strain S238N-H82 / ATCC MYA-4686) TaxID=486041 RepID=B0DHR1_LACBS|nr:uncharacterized protein LACBIDRAFT_329343 [Laccaria bicolor S238N-H82]EDR05772.1 predicted protein [Laccaria bicolor S238N-H82]|eukprot:XP_001883448.1 predicted protein [Laccaria bicolor S238N-H82]